MQMRLSIRPMLRGYIEQKAKAWRMSETDALNRIVEDARLAELESLDSTDSTGENLPQSREIAANSDPLADDIFGEMV